MNLKMFTPKIKRSPERYPKVKVEAKQECHKHSGKSWKGQEPEQKLIRKS